MNLTSFFWQILYPVLVLALGFLVIAYRWDRTPWARRGVDAVLRRISPGGGVGWLELWHLVAIVSAIFAFFAVGNYLDGLYQCKGIGGDDTLAFLTSGRAFLGGHDPFFVQVCMQGDDIPYGLAAVALNALAAPLGLLGVWLVWDLVALSLLPLVWMLAGPDRRYVTILVATSALFIPEVCGQITGASNAIVPLTLLLSVFLLASHRRWASVLGGLLSTARFPALFPILGNTGGLGKDRWWVPTLTAGAFGAATLLAYAEWGSGFVNVVFLSQVTRTGQASTYSMGSENYFGVLMSNGLAPGGYALPVLQGALTLLLVEEVWRRRFSPLRGGVVVIVGITLLTQYLPFSFLIWLLPLALLGAAEQRGLWVLSLVGTADYGLGYNLFYSHYGVVWVGQGLDLVVTAVLLWQFVLLWKAAEAEAGRAGSGTGPNGTPRSTRDLGQEGSRLGGLSGQVGDVHRGLGEGDPQ